jgi:thiol-disulfide isomerase/thioredoxin
MVVSNQLVSTKVDFQNIVTSNHGVVVFKFSADWCAPCKKILPIVDSFKKTIEQKDNIIWYDIDVDDSIEIFGWLKTKRIVNGVPSIIAYFEENDTIYPNEFVLGANEKDLDILFKQLLEQTN